MNYSRLAIILELHVVAIERNPAFVGLKNHSREDGPILTADSKDRHQSPTKIIEAVMPTIAAQTVAVVDPLAATRSF